MTEVWALYTQVWGQAQPCLSPKYLFFSAAHGLRGRVGLVFSLAYAKYWHFLLKNGMGLAYSPKCFRSTRGACSAVWRILNAL
jgi:hypothetical protein